MKVTLETYIRSNDLNPETPTGAPWYKECDPNATLVMIHSDQNVEYTQWICEDGTQWVLVEDPRAPHSFLSREVEAPDEKAQSYELQEPYKALEDYLLADHGYDLAVEPDGSHSLIARNTYYRDDKSVRIHCPGMGNLDSTVFCDGFVEQAEDGCYYEKGTGRLVGYLENVIRECIQNGDVEDFIDDMKAAISRGVEELMRKR